ncbi:Lysosome-associated membrane glycoprotein 5, partial [Branchiostoma belcheri]
IFKGDYVVKDQNGSICVRGSFNARLSIWYQSKRGGKGRYGPFLGARINERTVDQAALELPQRPVITGRCGTDKEPAVMDLRWSKGRYRLKLFFSVQRFLIVLACGTVLARADTRRLLANHQVPVTRLAPIRTGAPGQA